MDEIELARTIAAEEGGDLIEQTEIELAAPGKRSLVEAMSVASFLASAAQVAVQLYNVRQDRALLTAGLLEKAPERCAFDPERRLGLIGRIVDRLVPQSLAASPSLGLKTEHTKEAWVKEWLGIGSRHFSPTVLMPFADMRNFVVYTPISWSPPENAPGPLPTVTVPAGFVTDLATVPNYFWWALPPSGRYGHAAILHDWLYWSQPISREAADRVFDVAMDEMSVALTLRKAMWAAVRVYGGRYWAEATEARRQGASRVLKIFPNSPQFTWEQWRSRPDVLA